jgi:hypothetical protein
MGMFASGDKADIPDSPHQCPRYHWTGHSIGAALFQHAEQLAKFARVRNHNSSSAQVFRHPNLSLSRYSPALASELISSPDGS